jgi:predicted nucleic acid-binding protein
MARIIVDTSVLVGALDGRDHWNPQAKALLDRLSASRDEIIYLDCVLGECVSVLCRRMRQQGRGDQIPRMLDQIGTHIPVDNIVWTSPEWPRLYPAVLALVRQTFGVLNFNDALIALLCQESGIAVIASFDQGFDALPWLTRISQ